jgi:hypothetical protein
MGGVTFTFISRMSPTEKTMSHRRWFCLFLIAAILCGCGRYGGKLSQPPESHVDLSDLTLTKFDALHRDSLFQYVAGNPRWEVRYERGVRYAVRLERVNGEYASGSNGFFSTHEDGGTRQTRVMLSFGKPYGFGNDPSNVTRVKPGSKDVPLIVEAEHPGTPGNSSYVVIDGGLVFLEIYDQAPELTRKFTQAAVGEVCAELQKVLRFREQIDQTGILPVPDRYPKPLPTGKHIEVKNELRPGCYAVEAAANPTEIGYICVKAFEVKTGKNLSEDAMTAGSARFVGWSGEGKSFFPYQSVVFVYEGAGQPDYEARFELWHLADSGRQTKLAETTRMVSGWVDEGR